MLYGLYREVQTAAQREDTAEAMRMPFFSYDFANLLCHQSSFEELELQLQARAPLFGAQFVSGTYQWRVNHRGRVVALNKVTATRPVGARLWVFVCKYADLPAHGSKHSDKCNCGLTLFAIRPEDTKPDVFCQVGFFDAVGKINKHSYHNHQHPDRLRPAKLERGESGYPMTLAFEFLPSTLRQQLINMVVSDLEAAKQLKVFITESMWLKIIKIIKAHVEEHWERRLSRPGRRFEFLIKVCFSLCLLYERLSCIFYKFHYHCYVILTCFECLHNTCRRV